MNTTLETDPLTLTALGNQIIVRVDQPKTTEGKIHLADESIKRPNTGVITSCGIDCDDRQFKAGMRIAFVNGSGTPIDREGEFRVMDERNLLYRISE